MAYENLEKALLFISRSNGGINRNRSEQSTLGDVRAFLAMQPYDLQEMNNWFASLNEEQAETVLDGDQDSAEKIMTGANPAPEFTQTLLNDWFERC